MPPSKSRGVRRKPRCEVFIHLVLDRLDCVLVTGHTGLHQHVTEDGVIIRWKIV